MPVMPRIRGKAKDIAYKILGIPANIRNKTKNSDSKVKEKLDSEYTRLVR